MLSRITLAFFAFFCLTVLALTLKFPVTKVSALPDDFTDEFVTDIGLPTALAFTPGGRLLVTTQTGQFRIYQNGSLLSNAAVNLNSRLCTNSEQGLLGVAVDPQF